MITYINQLTAKEYNILRQAVGFRMLGEKQAQRGLEHTDYLVVAKDGSKTVGMARVLFDFGYVAYIADVLVLPKYQRQGIGKKMMGKILKFLEDNTTKGEFMLYALNAAKDKEGFYEKFGFIKRPCDTMGAGMTKRIN
jgi:GNAT superfamily N-acetyltransferase